jgi:RNA-directed DNA polymerase
VREKGLIQKNDQQIGIPQGSPISALLSNVYLLDFDRQMSVIASRTGGLYRRYSDDILWICPIGAADEIEREVYRCIGEFRLEINTGKTETSVFRHDCSGQLVSDRPLQYLGFVFDGKQRLVRPNTLARYYRRVKTAIRRAQKMAAKAGIDRRVFRRQIYKRFSHLGTRNFISYGRRAAVVMRADSIRRQVGRHWRKLHKWLPNDR